MKTSELDLSLRCIKYLLFAVNFLFVLTGIAAICIGTTLYVVYNDNPFFWNSRYFTPSILLIIVGFFIFAVAFCGCCGALKESTCMVLTFSVSLSVVLILEFSAAVIAYMMKDNAVDLVVDATEKAMHKYTESPMAADDFLRTQLNCCRFNGGPNDMSLPKAKAYNETEDSCCTWYTYYVNPKGSDVCTNVYKMNCHYALSTFLNENAVYILSSVMAISFVQLVGIMLACTLGRAIRKQKTDREMQRWQLRSSRPDNYQSIMKN